MNDAKQEPESLGRKLVKALQNSKGSGKRTVEVDHEGTTASASVNGSGPYGSSLDRLRVTGPERSLDAEDEGREVERQCEQLERQVSYLPERLKQHEVDPSLGAGVLRSHPEDMREREYHEVKVKKAREMEVSRYRYRPEETDRERIPQSYAHETLERLADDLAGALEPGGDEDAG